MATNPGGAIFPAAGNGYHVNCPTLLHVVAQTITFWGDKLTHVGEYLRQSSSKIGSATRWIARVNDPEAHILPRFQP
jgi:hypothetical protein